MIVPHNPELEAAIHANPADDAAYLVYADWLQQHGDPLGEQIVGHARGGAAYLTEHETDMLGPLADYKEMLQPIAWRNGFVRSARVAANAYRDDITVEDLLAMLLDEPVARFIDDLTLGIVKIEDSNSYTGCMKVLGARTLRTLRSLYIGDFASEETELNWSHLGDASVFYAAVPNLRTLTLRSGTMTLGAIDLPELRAFTTLTGGLQRDAIESIAGARWPKLERLALQIGSSRYESDITVSDLEPILDGKGLPPTLRHLGLANFELTEELIPPLAASAILRRITELDLSLGTLGRDGADALIAAKDAFAHLAVLDLSQSWLDPDTVRRIVEVFPNALVGQQNYDPRYPDDRYISAGE